MLFQELTVAAFAPRETHTGGPAGGGIAGPGPGLRPEARPVALRAPAVAPHRILLVEDERVTRKAMTLLLAVSGYPTQAAGSAEEALRLVERGGVPPIAIVDLDLPGMNGLELITRLEQADPAVVPVLITAVGDDALNAALQGRRVKYLRKPVDFDALLLLLSRQSTARGKPQGTTRASLS